MGTQKTLAGGQPREPEEPAAAAVAALALGIGANTAVFSLMDAVVLRPLPYPHPERLMSVDPTEHGHAMVATSWPMFRDWQEQSRIFESLAGYMAGSARRQCPFGIRGD
jgi:putative ABC transport system permease protein